MISVAKRLEKKIENLREAEFYLKNAKDEKSKQTFKDFRYVMMQELTDFIVENKSAILKQLS